MIWLKRTDIADEEESEINLDEGPVELGRGPLLRIDATNVSRKHVQLRCEDGKVILKCLHRIPVQVQHDGTEESIQQHEETEVHTGDVIYFLPDKFYFEFNIPRKAALQPQSTSRKMTPQKQEKNAVTGSAEKKQRKLPDWMLEKQKTTPNKENSPPGKPDRNTPLKRPQIKKGSTQTLSTEKEGAKPKATSPEPEKTKRGESEKSMHKNSPNKPTEKVCVAHRRESKHKGSEAATEKVEAGTSSTGSSSTGSTKASGSRNVFPVLITPEDLKDSDDEVSPKKKPVKDRRPVCPYGEKCYRQNPHHFETQSHPGDPDYAPGDENKDDNDDRPECEYGVDCYRKNPGHRKQYKHTHKPQPKRKAKARTKRDDGDDYESDFIDDEDIEEDIDDTDEDEDWEYPKDADE